MKSSTLHNGDCRKTGCAAKIARMALLSEDLMDALSLTRACPERSRRRVEGERVGVWVSAPLPDTRTHWRRRKWIRGAFGRPACTLSPTLSRKLNGRGAGRTHALNRARSWRLSLNGRGRRGLALCKHLSFGHRTAADRARHGIRRGKSDGLQFHPARGRLQGNDASLPQT